MLTPPSSSSHQPQHWLDLKATQNAAQLLGKTLYHQGDLSYFEAVNKESLGKTYERVGEEGIIVVARQKGSKMGPTVRLGEEWLPSRTENGSIDVDNSKLWAFCERISLSRREGKNRRDGATIKTRVLNMVDLVGRILWDRTGVELTEAVVLNDAGAKQTQRRRGIQASAKL